MAPNLSNDNRKKFLNIIRLVKKNYPVAHPVKIRTVKKLSKNEAQIQFFNTKQPYFLITIKQTDYAGMVSNLIHEYSHAMAWKLSHNSETTNWHDESWGVEYAKLYKYVIESPEVGY